MFVRRVFFDTSFDTKQLKLGPKLVSWKLGSASIPAVVAIPSVVIPAVAGVSAVAGVPSVTAIIVVAGPFVLILQYNFTQRVLCCCWCPKVRRLS
jgi:hypothetical protein